MSVFGSRVLRKEDAKFLTTGGEYTADISDPLLDAAAHVIYVRSMMAHAEIGEIDISGALDMPGVIGVFTSAHTAGLPLLAPGPMVPAAFSRPVLATDRVRFVGELVAAIVAETPQEGADAAESIWPDYEPLPAVIDLEDARTDHTLLFPEAETNLAAAVPMGTTDGFFDGCEVVVTQDLVNQRLAGCPLEVRSSAAAWDSEGRLHQWISTQTPQQARNQITRFLGVAEGTVHVIAPDVGGGFGPKIGIYAEETLLGWIAQQVGRPVRWTETRSENMVGMGHGRGQRQKVEIGGSRDGSVSHYRLHVLQDAGAYPMLGAYLPFLTNAMSCGVYDIPNIEFDSKSFVTNTTPTVAYRGAGRPEATAAIERAMDLFARRDRPRPHRGPPEEPHRQGPVPVHRSQRHGLRHRRLRDEPRPRPRGGRLSSAPSRAGTATRIGLGSADGHRRLGVRRGDGRADRGPGVRPCRDRPRRTRHGLHRQFGARPGPRHGLCDDRRRRTRHPDLRRRGETRRHRRGDQGSRHVRLPLAPARRIGHQAGKRAGGRTRLQACCRPARRGRRRRRSRQGVRWLPRDRNT